MTVQFVDNHNTLRVTRQSKDPKIYSESAFWYMVKNALLRLGYPVIKKEMTKDGHMVSEGVYYVRSKNMNKSSSFWVYDNNYAIRSAYEPYNRDGVVDLSVGFPNQEKSNPTYAQEMKAKYGVPFDPHRVKSSGGFRFGDRVMMDSDAESWQSGVPRGATGTVWAIHGMSRPSVSPDPMGKMIYVKWDKYGEKSVWKGTLTKIKGNPLKLPKTIYCPICKEDKGVLFADTYPRYRLYVLSCGHHIVRTRMPFKQIEVASNPGYDNDEVEEAVMMVLMDYYPHEAISFEQLKRDLRRKVFRSRMPSDGVISRALKSLSQGGEVLQTNKGWSALHGPTGNPYYGWGGIPSNAMPYAGNRFGGVTLSNPKFSLVDYSTMSSDPDKLGRSYSVIGTKTGDKYYVVVPGSGVFYAIPTFPTGFKVTTRVPGNKIPRGVINYAIRYGITSLRNPVSPSDVADAFWSGKAATGSNLFSSGDKAFSYGTVILQRLPNGEVLGNVTKYSVTTSKHQRELGVSRADIFVDNVPRGVIDLVQMKK